MRLPKVLHRQPRRIAIAAVCGLLVTVILAGLVGLALNRSVEEATDEALEYDVLLENQADDLMAAVLDVRRYHRNLTLAGPSRGGIADLEESYASLQEQIQQLDQLGIEDPEAPQPQRLREMAEGYYAGFRPAIDSYDSQPEAFMEASDNGLVQLDELENAVQEIQEVGKRRSEAALASVEEATTTARLALILVIVGLMLAGAALAYIAVRTVNELRSLYTREKKATRKLRTSEERYKALYEDNPSMYFTLDAEGTVLSVNGFGAEQLGYTVEELIGRPVLDVFHEEDKEDVSRNMRACLRNTKQINGWEARKVRKDGSMLWVRENVRVVRSPDRSTIILVACEDITERKRAEEELRLQKTLLEAQSEASIDGILVVSEDGKMMSFNRCFVEMWEIPAEVVATRSDEAALEAVKDKLVNPQEFLARVAYLYDHPDEESHEEILLKDGRTFDRYSAPVKSADGTYYGRVWFFRDITERKKNEEAVREAEERFRSAFDNAPIGVAVVSLEGRYLQANPALCQILGYSEEELLNKTYRDITYPEDFDLSKQYERRILSEEIDTYQMEKRYVRADGHPVWVSLSVSMVRDTDNRPLRFIAQVQDITERKKNEEALRESEERFRTAFESTPIGMALMGLDGRWLKVNRSLCEILGYSEEELLATNFQSITHPEDLDRDLECMRQLLSGEIRSYQVEKRYSHKLGHTVWALLNASVVRDAQGRPIYGITQIQDITRSKWDKIELERLSRQNESILKSAGEGIYGLDSQGRTTFINPAAAKMLGYEPEELAGRHQHEIVHHSRPDGTPYPTEECAIYAPLHDGEVHGSSNEIFWRKDGTSFPVEYVSTPIREKGRVVGAVVTFRDITERKRAEEALKESEERYRRLVELSPDAVIVQSGGDVVYINDAGTRLLGASSPEEIVGKPILSFVHPDYREAVRERIRQVREEGLRAGLLEEKLVRLDGGVVEAEVVAAPIVYLGKPAAQVVVRDVSERKRAVSALRESEERFRLLAENMSDLVCLHEPDGRYLYLSPSCHRLLGYEPDELIGTDPYALFHPDDAARVHSEAHAKVLEGESLVSVIYRIRKKSGEYTWFETLTEPILDNKGNVVRLQTSSRDISERKKAEEALAEAAQAKTDFLADISHELRTPLTVIRGNAEVGLQLKRDCVHAEILEEIVTESGSMSRMVEDLLFLARSDSVATPLDEEPVPVEQFLTDLVGRAEVLVRKRGALLETSLSGEGLLRVDPTRTEQAVLALVDNAAKYGPEGGTVLLSSRVLPSPDERGNGRPGEHPTELCIEIVDEGPGISKEDLARVFERFYRVNKDRSKKTGGTGLGLSIARSIVEAHGGRIEAESRPGEGTKMDVYLPLVPAKQPIPNNAS